MWQAVLAMVALLVLAVICFNYAIRGIFTAGYNYARQQTQGTPPNASAELLQWILVDPSNRDFVVHQKGLGIVDVELRIYSKDHMEMNSFHGIERDEHRAALRALRDAAEFLGEPRSSSEAKVVL